MPATLTPIEQAIGRPLREAEKAIDVELLDAAMNEAKDELEAAIRDEMLAKAKIWQRSGWLPALELSVEMSRPLEALYELGKVEAYNELVRLGYRPARKFAASRRLRHRGLDPLRDRVRAGLGGIRIRTERGLVEAELSDASSAALFRAMQAIPGPRALASDVISTALTSGLGATFDENADLIHCWEYTAVMDAGTCVNCRVMDGTKYRTLTELYSVLPNFGPNPHCLGGGRCRCRAVPCVPNSIDKVKLPPISGRSADTLATTLNRRAQAMERGVMLPGMATTFYTFQTSTGPSGLVRRRRSASVDTIERVTPDEEWVEDRDLIRYFVNPGTSFLEEIDTAEAERLAKRYGVELEALAVG
jgi:hypothetical protein